MKIEPVLRSVVALRSSIPEDAFTAGTLGTLREGSGVVIRDNGLVLTIGYLITEAEEVWLTRHDGRVVPAPRAGLRPGNRLRPGAGAGRARPAGAGVRRCGRGRGSAIPSCLPTAPASMSRPRSSPSRNSPAIGNICSTTRSSPRRRILPGAAPRWSAPTASCIGIGSLRLQMSRSGEVADINMVVPIDLLPPILDDLLTRGRVDKPPRPWLGVFSAESNGEVVVMSVSEGSPAAQAGLRQGDIISDVRDARGRRPRRLLPQALGERPGRRRGADADRARRPRDVASRQVRRPQQLSQEAATAVGRGNDGQQANKARQIAPDCC